MSRVFVTGANGFIGSRIVRALLAREHAVTALVGADLDNDALAGLGVELRELDLLDDESVQSALAGGQQLIHAAACYSFWQADPDRIYQVNVEGTQRVLRAAAHHGYRKIVYTSSTATLTPSINRDLETEESLFDLRSFQGHYKSSKMIAEIAVLREIARGLPVVIVHPTTVIGEGDTRPTPTGRIIVEFLRGLMKVYVDTVLNVVDVERVADGHVLALERGRVGEQYILGGENLTMREITEILAELTGLAAPKIAIPPGLLMGIARVTEWIADHVTHRPPLLDIESVLHARSNRASTSSKAEKELGYHVEPGQVALTKATRWFVENGYCSPGRARRIQAHAGWD